MKKLLFLAAMAAAFNVPALDNLHTILTTPYSMWSGGTTNASTTLSYVVVPAHSTIANAIPVVQSIAAYSDKLTGKVQTYKVVETTVCTYTNTTVSIPINSTNTGTAWDSGVIIIRHLLSDTYEKRTLTTSGGGTNLQVTAASFSAVVPGDIIYKTTTTGAATFNLVTNTVGANLMNYVNTGTALVVGQPGMPLLMEVDATGSVGNFANATATYVVPGPSIPRLTP